MRFPWNTGRTIQDLLGMAGNTRTPDGTVEFLGKQYELKPETLSDKVRSVLRRSQINTYYVIFKFRVTTASGHSHRVYIRTTPRTDLSGPVQVYCDCPDFKYRCAYGLEQSGALFRSTGTDTRLGEAITVAPKSKTQTVALCKHLLAALSDLSTNINFYLG